MTGQAFELLRRVRYVFYPRRCALCGRVVAPQTEYCSACRSAVRRVPLPICPCCGCGSRDCACEKHRSRYVAVFASPFYYEGCVREGVHRLKFRAEPEVAEAFGREMAAFARQVFAGVTIDMVTFVPMTQREMRERRYNQSELLAKATAQALLLPCEPTLEKLYETYRQRTLDQRRRSGNVFGVFETLDPQAIAGKRILLCDDLRTTGATLTECAKMLRIRGAREVLCLTAAVNYPK
jgi:ComF family protein